MVNTSHMDDHLIPTREAARILGVSVATMNRYAATGEVIVSAKSPGKRGANLFNRAYIEREARRSQQKAGA